MKATIKGDILIIEIPLQPAKLSASGKTKVVATGNLKSDLQVDGKPLTIGLNAYYSVSR